MEISTAVLCAFGAMVLWSVGDFFVQRAAKAIGSFEALTWVNLIGGLGLLPFVVKDLGSLAFMAHLPSLLALALIDFAFGLTLLRAYEKGKLSVVEIIMIAELPFTILLGLAIFGERLSLLQSFLILMILAGAFLISQGERGLVGKLLSLFAKRGRTLEKGVWLALAAALLSAFYNFFVAVNAREVSPVMAIWFPWVVSLILLVAYMLYQRGTGKFLKDGFKYKRVVVFGAVIDTAAWLLFAIALSENELSVTTAITESYPALAMFLGVKFNKEKITSLQYAGAVMALAASIGMAFAG